MELRKKLRRQIFENHKEKFAKCFLNADFIHEHYLLLNELEQVKNSKTYKLGKLILSPFAVFKK
ncbi:MAG: hypothetical protein JNM96_03995 [Bacteroidia bacterium]|nr:hypothetical protein [Bacteroidia bacterium]